MSDDGLSIPTVGTPIVDPNGQINQVWFRFFYKILVRTGGTSGDDVATLTKGLALLLARFAGQQASTEGMVAIPPRRPESLAPYEVATRRFDPVPAPAEVPYRRVDPFAPPERIINHGQHQDGGLHAVVTTAENGFMSAADKAKLDGIAAYGDPNDWAQVAKASLPTPSAANRGWRRFVTDATGATGIIPAYCTGTAWKRFADDSTVN